MTEECDHADLEVGSEVQEMRGPSGDLFMSIRIRVRCDSCGQHFSWRGLNSGVANADEPVTTADGYELVAPIVPRPGGVVGILAMAGLEDKLEDNPHA